MRLLLLDVEGLGLDFALRSSEAGHDVRWFRMDQKKSRDGEGFKGITRVADWRPHMAWAREGLILNTGNCKYLMELDRYRELGFPIFGPSQKSAELEIKRSAGMDLLKKAGIDLPPYKMFNSLEEAAAHARKSSDAFVFKTMGDECDKSLTYVSKDPADMVGWIEQKIARGLKLRGQCMLQEKIDMLCEFGVSGWFGKEGFLEDKWQICFEHKKLMNGEIGPATGEQGTVVQYAETDLLAEECLIPLEAALRKLGHRGDTAINAGIDRKGKAWPFEFTMRLGYPCFFLQLASHKGDPVQWMKDALSGKDSLEVSREVCTGVVLAQPPYPSEKYSSDEVEGNPISGMDDVWEDVHPCGVMIGKGPVMDGGKVAEKPMYQTTSPYVLVATGLGQNVAASKKSVYNVIDRISFPNMMFRTDIGDKVRDALPGLHRHGYALTMKPGA
jgi:phosphoribosylamine--glycine ligase